MDRQNASTRNRKRLMVTVLALFLLLAIATHATKISDAARAAATIEVAQAKVLFDRGAVFVDVRPTNDWETGRIPHAIHLELDKMLVPAALSVIASKTEPIVIYGDGPTDSSSTTALALARTWGFTRIYDFRPGYAAWLAAGYAIE